MPLAVAALKSGKHVVCEKPLARSSADARKILAAAKEAKGFLLPAMGKEQLFKTVMADGVLPRKTFSMGHAQDKRYYVEARKIR